MKSEKVASADGNSFFIRTFSLSEKVLTFENTQINLVFHSLIRTFAAKITKDEKKYRDIRVGQWHQL